MPEVPYARPPDRPTDSGCARRARPADVLAWLGGARRGVLKHSPSERSIYAAFGVAVVITAIFGGVAAALAVRYAASVSTPIMVAVGLFWGVALANVDRLLVCITSGKERLIALIPRIAISAVVGYLIASVLILLLFAPEINALITSQQTAALTRSQTSITGYYDPRIATDNRTVANIQAQLTSRRQQINYLQFKARCEAGETDCSTSGHLGMGPFYYRYLGEAKNAQLALQAVTPQLESEIKTARADAAALKQQETQRTTEAGPSVLHDAGLLARAQALQTLESRSSEVREVVWLVLIAFVLIDLTPLFAKTAFVMLGRPVYEQNLESQREAEGTHGYGVRARTRVDRAAIDHQAAADEDVDEQRIDVEREERLANLDARNPQWSPTGDSDAARSRARPIRGRSLAQYVKDKESHARQPTPLHAALTRAAWVGTVLIGLGALALQLITGAGHVADERWIVLVMFVLAISLAGYTHGFRVAPGWAHRIVFALLPIGIVLPLLLLATNA